MHDGREEVERLRSCEVRTLGRYEKKEKGHRNYAHGCETPVRPWEGLFEAQRASA